MSLSLYIENGKRLLKIADAKLDPRQLWRFEARREGQYAIGSAALAARFSLDLINNSHNDKLYDRADQLQVWTLIPWGDGTYKIVDTPSGINGSLDLSNNAQPILNPGDHPGQHWRLIKAEPPASTKTLNRIYLYNNDDVYTPFYVNEKLQGLVPPHQACYINREGFTKQKRMPVKGSPPLLGGWSSSPITTVQINPVDLTPTPAATCCSNRRISIEGGDTAYIWFGENGADTEPAASVWQKALVPEDVDIRSMHFYSSEEKTELPAAFRIETLSVASDPAEPKLDLSSSSAGSKIRKDPTIKRIYVKNDDTRLPLYVSIPPAWLDVLDPGELRCFGRDQREDTISRFWPIEGEIFIAFRQLDSDHVLSNFAIAVLHGDSSGSCWVRVGGGRSSEAPDRKQWEAAADKRSFNLLPKHWETPNKKNKYGPLDVHTFYQEETVRAVLGANKDLKPPFDDQTQKIFDATQEANNKEDFSKAVNLITPLIVPGKTSWEFLRQRAIAYEGLVRYVDAEDDYTKASSLAPNEALLHNDKAIFYYRQGRFDRGYDEATKAIDLSPQTANFYKTRAEGQSGTLTVGSYYYEVEEPMKTSVISDFGKTLSLKPDDPDILSDRASYFMAVEEPAKAQRDLERLAALDPKATTPLFRLGKLFKETDPKTAIRYLTQGLDRVSKFGLSWDPKVAAAAHNRAELLSNKDDETGALKDLENIIQKKVIPENYNGDIGDLFVDYGWVLYSMKRWEEVETACSLGIRVRGIPPGEGNGTIIENGKLYALRGLSHLQRGQDEKARADFAISRERGEDFLGDIASVLNTRAHRQPGPYSNFIPDLELAGKFLNSLPKVSKARLNQP